MKVKLLVVALALVALVSQPRLASGESVSPGQCRTEKQNAVDYCKTVIFGQAPSAACCQVVRTGHLECGCPAYSPKVAALLTLERIISVLHSCGRAVPHNVQCGRLSCNLSCNLGYNPVYCCAVAVYCIS